MKLHLEHLPEDTQREVYKLLTRYDASKCADEIFDLKREIDTKQARIDKLVHSFCIDDENGSDRESFMEKIEEWKLTEYVRSLINKLVTCTK